ncbi:unknown protein, partial [Microcystis aeruginosa 11-30S32]
MVDGIGAGATIHSFVAKSRKEGVVTCIAPIGSAVAIGGDDIITVTAVEGI